MCSWCVCVCLCFTAAGPVNARPGETTAKPYALKPTGVRVGGKVQNKKKMIKGRFNKRRRDKGEVVFTSGHYRFDKRPVCTIRAKYVCIYSSYAGNNVRDNTSSS